MTTGQFIFTEAYYAALIIVWVWLWLKHRRLIAVSLYRDRMLTFCTHDVTGDYDESWARFQWHDEQPTCNDMMALRPALDDMLTDCPRSAEFIAWNAIQPEPAKDWKGFAIEPRRYLARA